MDAPRAPVRRPLLIAAGAVVAALPPWLLGIDAWPEIVVSAYFFMKGRVLYDTIIFPHTPLLIVATALLGKAIGLGPFLFRAMISICMAAVGALLARAGGWRGLLIGIPAYIVWCAFAYGVTFWPDPMMAALALGGAMALERFDATNDRASLRAAGLCLGFCILTKQTSAWMLLAAVLWLVAVKRERPRVVAQLVAWGAAPYAAFALLWGLAFRTLSHIYWTLVVPLSGHGDEIALFSGESLPKAAAMFLIVPLFLIITRRTRSPLPWIAMGVWGMGWPRFDLTHLSAATGILALMLVRSAEAVERRTVPAFATALLVTAAAPFFTYWRVGSGVFFWDDPVSQAYAEQVRRHIPPGGTFLNYITPFENIYALTDTTPPTTTYVNPRFWYYLNKRGIGETYCRELESRRGVPILFTFLYQTDDPRIAATCVYEIVWRAPVVEQVNPVTSWRMLPRLQRPPP